MALLCLLYFAAVSACLSLAGLLAERALPATAPRRWVWAATIPISLILPMVLSTHHSSPVIALWGLELVRMPMVHAAGPAAHHSVYANWLDCSGAYAQSFLPVWGTATAVLLAWGLANAIWLSWTTRRARAAQGDARQVDGVPVVVTDSMGPATVGLLRSRVLVPRWVLGLPGLERRYVIRHEDEHRRAHDTRLLCFASFMVCLFPWNLPLWFQLRRLRLAVELDCDRRVVVALGDARGYGALLLKVAEAASRGPRLQPALLGRVGMLERRLTMLLAPAPRRLAQRLLAPVLAIAVVAIVLSVPHPEVSRPEVANAEPGRPVPAHH